jgi:uncharacterized membrane protein
LGRQKSVHSPSAPLRPSSRKRHNTASKGSNSTSELRLKITALIVVFVIVVVAAALKILPVHYAAVVLCAFLGVVLGVAAPQKILRLWKHL